MITLNTKKQDDGTWVDGTHEAFSETEFFGMPFKLCIRSIPKTRLSKAMNKNTKTNGRGVEKTDNVAMMTELYQFALVDWKDISNEDKEAMECNAENKDALAENYFASLVAPVVEIAQTLNDVQEVTKAQEEKN